MIYWCYSGTIVVGVINNNLIRFMAHSMMCKLCWTLLGVTRNLRVTDLRPNQILLFTEKNMAMKWFLMTFCYTHRLVSGSTTISEAFSCSIWELVQTFISGTMCRKLETLEPSFLNEMSPFNYSLQGSGNSQEEETDRCKKQRAW